MSISDEVRPPSDGPGAAPEPSRSSSDQRPRQPSGGDFERTPPQDIAAEQCVLGGMLLSKDAIADVVEILRTNDFYQPKHGIVFDAILDIYGRGEPADLITVASALVDAGDINRVGGAAYLHTLVSSVPTAANAAYYARIVADRAVLRRLIEAGTRVTQLGYGVAAGAGRDIDDIVDMAQQAIYDVTERRISEDFAPLNELLQPTLDEIEAIGANGGVMTGVPTGFTDLDQLLNGLHPGQLVIVAGRPGLGKALALDTPLPTPDGWTTMGEVRVGDDLIGADGRPTRVVAATDVMQGRPCYEVEFSDGTVIVADAQHQWRTSTRAGRRQPSERRPRPRRSSDGMHRLDETRAAAGAGPDQPVPLSAALSDAGTEFRHVLHTVAGRAGAAGTVTRTYTRRGQPWVRRIPAYGCHDGLSALHDRASMPINQGRSASHRDVVTTEQIAATLRCHDSRPNHAVEVAAAMDLPDRDLPVPPYTLGYWLGDGDAAGNRYTSADPEIAEYIEEEGLRVTALGGSRYSIRLPTPPGIAARSCVVCGRSFQPKAGNVRTCGRSCAGKARFVSGPEPEPRCPACGRRATGTESVCRQCRGCCQRHGSFTALLRSVGVCRNKHIPACYLRSSRQQRRALLAGLLDSDGDVMASGTVRFAVTSRRLAVEARELVLSLGYQASLTTQRVAGRTAESSTCYVVTFRPADPVFRLRRKLARQRLGTGPTTRRRYVVDVRPVATVPVRCVQVDSADHMYLAGESWVPTHNSTVAMDFARSCSIRNNMSSVIFSLEMSKVEIVMRLLSAEARVPLHTLRSGQLSDDDWTKLARRMGEVSEAPLFCDDTPNMNLMEIRAKARRLKQRHDIRLIVVDYLQLMSAPKRVESRQQEVAELSRGLKLLAKEVDCPVIAVSQLNRGPEQRTDKRPQLSDLRESGSIEQDADVVLLLHRDDYYDKESPRAGEADFIVAKHRNGPTDTVTVAAQLHLSRFVDMAVG